MYNISIMLYIEMKWTELEMEVELYTQYGQ